MIKTKASAYKVKAGDIVGQRVVLGCAFSLGRTTQGNRFFYFVVECSCGEVDAVPASKLRAEEAKTCKRCRSESLIEGNVTHGETNTKLYKVWDGMKQRCYNSNDKDYHRYGGDGITISDEWRFEFVNFRAWALANGYRDGLQIHRERKWLGYFDGNCVWITASEHAKITRAEAA